MKPYQKKYKPKGTNTHTVWTESDIATLRELYAQGVSNWDISKELNRSHGAIQSRVYLLRLHEKKSDSSETLPNKSWWRRLLGI
jgi:hypothetical protein